MEESLLSFQEDFKRIFYLFVDTDRITSGKSELIQMRHRHWRLECSRKAKPITQEDDSSSDAYNIEIDEQKSKTLLILFYLTCTLVAI